jgi:uncharacterized membrane protein YeaQ/YmgE (transglycosylase-associated protein family)
MNIIAWLVLGVIAGWIASMLMGTNESQGMLMDIVMGVVGALLGGFLFSLVGFGGVSGFNLYSLFVAVIGAVVLTWISRQIQRTST